MSSLNRNRLAIRRAVVTFALTVAVLFLNACDLFSQTGPDISLTLSGPGSVVSSPAGIACPGNCSAKFAQDQAVSLEPLPQPGAVFTGWGGACSGLGGCTLRGDAQVSATFTTAAPERLSEAFTLVFLPDTQNYICSECLERDPATDRWHPELFLGQLKWIERERDRQTIAFVSHAGDIVQNASKLSEWQVADDAFRRIDSVLPYSAVAGDHEYFPQEYRDGNTLNYRRYFGEARFAGEDWYVGSSPGGLSHAQHFVAGGALFLHIGLEFEAPGPVSDPDSALGWAKSILEANPGVPTIITTHAYLMDGENRRAGPQDQESCLFSLDAEDRTPCPDDKGGYLDPDASSAEEIFQELVRPNPQVFMVLGGNYHRSELRGGGPDSDNGEYHQVSRNAAGGDVFEMLANYQSYQNGGDGWLRLIRFVPGEGGDVTIEVKTYSPSRDEFQPGSASDFSFTMNLKERFGPGE